MKTNITISIDEDLIFQLRKEGQGISGPINEALLNYLGSVDKPIDELAEDKKVLESKLSILNEAIEIKDKAIEEDKAEEVKQKIEAQEQLTKDIAEEKKSPERKAKRKALKKFYKDKNAD